MALKLKMLDLVKVLSLLTYGLTNFDLIEINKAKKPIDKVDVWLGKRSTS